MSPPYVKFDVRAYMRGEPQPHEIARAKKEAAGAAPPRNPYRAWVQACERSGNWDLPFEPYTQPDRDAGAGEEWNQIPPAYSLQVAAALRAPPDMESVLIAKITGPLLLRLEGWGRNAGFKNGDARRLLADLFDACGPARQHHIPTLFEMCVRKAGVVDRDKIAWLRKQVAEIQRNDAYFPRERPEIRDDRSRNAVMKVIREAPCQVADIGTLMMKMKRSRDAIVGLTRRLIDEQLIVRVGMGQFTLPGNASPEVVANALESAADQVVAWFKAQPPGMQARAVDIVKAIGRPRTAVDSALHGNGKLIKKGAILQVSRGLFRLPDSAA
jgi:hypothetical protein